LTGCADASSSIGARLRPVFAEPSPCRTHYSDEDDDTYQSGDGDDSTCLTYESQENKNKQSRRYENKKKIHHVEDESTLDDEEETLDDYTNDETTLDSRKKQPAPVYSRKKMIPVAEPKEVVFNKTKNINTKENTSIVSSLPLPIEELEYDDQIDGADVSVMTPSTPSLMESNFVSATALMHGKENYMPHELGMTVEESIQKSPRHFYRHVVQHLLQTHEPEKVRLLDKLMLKYNAREEHLIQKLTLRYNRHTKEQNEKDTPTIAEDRSYNPNDQESTMDSVAINENKVMVDNSISSKSLRDVSFFSSTSVVKDQPMVETNIISKSSSSNGAFQEDKPQEAFEKEWPSPNNSNNDNDKLQQHEQLSQEDKSTAKMDLSNAKSIQKHHGETILDIPRPPATPPPPIPPS